MLNLKFKTFFIYTGRLFGAGCGSIVFIIIIFYITLPTACCGNTELSVNAVWEDIIAILNTFDEGQINRFNDVLDQRERELEQQQSSSDSRSNLIQNIVIALAINATIIFLSYYGPTIWENINNSVQQMTEMVSNVFFETARRTALNRLHNMSQEEQLVAREILLQIASNRSTS